MRRGSRWKQDFLETDEGQVRWRLCESQSGTSKASAEADGGPRSRVPESVLQGCQS